MLCNEGFGRSPRGNASRLIGRAATAFSALALAATISVANATPVTGAAHRVDPAADSSQEDQHVRSGKGSGKGSQSIAQEAVRYAESKIGAPYRWGAAGPDAFDCSGLVQWSYRQVGVTLKRTTYDQATQGKPVSRSQLRPGDLVFFYSDRPDRLHVRPLRGELQLRAPGRLSHPGKRPSPLHPSVAESPGTAVPRRAPRTAARPAPPGKDTRR